MTIFSPHGILTEVKDGLAFKQFTLILLFFLITPIVIFTSLISLLSLQDSVNPIKSVSAASNHRSGVRIYASLPASFPSTSGTVNMADGRPELVRKYLNFYHSPLEPYADELVATADFHQLDYRLLTAIAQQESNLCKIIPPGTHNCWGWGIHSKGTLGFNSYSEAIVTVSQGLRQEYLDKGYTTPDEIMSKYTPLSNGSWSDGVNKFMAEIEDGSYF